MNTLAGDLWLNDTAEIGYGDHSEQSAARVALDYYEQAIEREPEYADALSGKAHALLRLGDNEGALAAAQAGLTALPRAAGFFMKDPEFYRLVAEEVYDGAVQALITLGRLHEAWQILSEGLALFPDGEYLRDLLPELEA